jgi:UDP-N-acetylmuramyl pentapeptide phosphotransferase/UDP-N-acetylglucosamine-1-phosphate transferase
MFNELAVFALGLASTFAVMPTVIKKMKEKQIGGVDVHKKSHPFIPEMGGIAVLIGVTLSGFAAILLAPEKTGTLASFLGSVLIAGIIGAIDDLKTLNAKVKPALTLLASVPILLLHTYYSYGPAFPLIGQTRMTMVYPLLIPIAIAVTSNAVNMMDPFNGTMSGTCTITTLFLLLSAILLGYNNSILLCLCLLGPVLALYYFNRFPAKVFSGDVGSLSIGAALGAIAVIGRLEVVAIVAFAPQIMNAFYGLSTIGRLYERREVSRPVTVLEDGRLMATKDPKAPITLARMILARGPLYEYEATHVFIALSAISGVLAVLTAYLIVVAS